MSNQRIQLGYTPDRSRLILGTPDHVYSWPMAAAHKLAAGLRAIAGGAIKPQAGRLVFPAARVLPCTFVSC